MQFENFSMELINAGRSAQTVDGRAVVHGVNPTNVVITLTEDGQELTISSPIIALVANKDGEHSFFITKTDGTDVHGNPVLVMQPRTFECFLNVYSGGAVIQFEDEEHAKAAGAQDEDYLRTVRVAL